MKLKLLFILVSTLLLSACLYPDEQRVEQMPTNEEQLQQVQNAVNQYKEQNGGLLPIKNSDMDTPIFIKYQIDFNTLKNANIMGQAPGNSFERGGVYSYVIINPEEETEVKVSDVRINQKLRSVNYEINLYRNEHLYPPYGETIGRNYFKIDTERMDVDEPFTVNSPYTGQKLDIIINAQGRALVDYRPDVYRLLEEENITEYEGDLRYLLTDHYPMVPAYSPPMKLIDGNVEFSSQDSETE
ncbi:hypothetical protein [Tenuibacillus multivorans]|uniref:ABC transporter periplasmic binding protein yphF n=1 Tax=Tenuibacillus multivorans TaxID=237069 RepID=A0A1H0CVM2_9BACI|nr:hypothetical protein [Tenuibacillus multivorans]GEL76149.1 hypothetical protein TMU01_03840 [Tenuibacillus multivorans]SDN61846.1 hypothetical protein SAMN05216498_2687 [Tenuibacillus multivorans]